MLSAKMIERLNKQVALEHYSAHLYLAMSAWCDHNGLAGSAAFLKAHSDEELAHGRKLFDYINETGALAVIGAIDAPPIQYGSLKEVIEKTFEHEKLITRSINELVDAALSEKDFSTFNFLQWYVGEQHEEERLFMSILDLFSIMQPEGRDLYLIDREIGSKLAR